MAIRELINGSLEPLWRKNAREDADKFRAEILRSPITRRNLMVGGGAAATAAFAEYIAQRRAVAFPFPHGTVSVAPSGNTNIINARTGTTYPYMQEGLYAMQDGDTLLIPAGATYTYQGQLRYYADYLNFNGWRFGTGGQFGVMYLGKSTNSPNYGSLYGNANYATIQGTGTANNGRALLTPTYGILAADFHTTDRELFLDPSTPVTNFVDPAVERTHGGDGGSYCSPLHSYNHGFFGNYSNIRYTGRNFVNNSLTGVTVLAAWNSTTALPAGSIVAAQLYNQGKAIFVCCGSNPGFTFNNLEMAYAIAPDPGASTNATQSALSNPDGLQVGSITWNNCYNHHCNQGSNLLSLARLQNSGLFWRMFDCEFYQNGTWSGQTHNIYCGHVDEFLMDNCYSHSACGGYEVKSRAPLSIISNCQVRGEGLGTDRNVENPNGSGPGGSIDLPDGGLVYLIGNVHESSRFCGNVQVQWNAEALSYHSTARAATNILQEVYLVNGTHIGPDNGLGWSPSGGPYSMGPMLGYNPYVMNTPMPYLGTSAAGSLPARKYWVQATGLGSTGTGETPASQMWGSEGTYSLFDEKIWCTISQSSSHVLTVQSPPEMTAATRWNVYVNYADPRMYWNSAAVTSNSTNYAGLATAFYWDAANTNPVFAFTSGGEAISITGTLNQNSASITGVTGIANVPALQNLVGLMVWVGGANTNLYVTRADGPTNTLFLSGTYTGITVTAGTITFGWYLSVGVTYVTALGDSANMAFESAQATVRSLNDSLSTTPGVAGYYHDGSLSYTRLNDLGPNCAYIAVPPGQKLIINAPPSGPAYATGVNFWVTPAPFTPYVFTGGPHDTNFFAFGGVEFQIGLTKVTSSPVAFGGSWTSPSYIFIKQQQVQRDMYLQNSSPIAYGTNWTEPTTSPGGIDPYSGLRNDLNTTANNLRWYKRSSFIGAGQIEGWFAIVPVGGLTNYVETIKLYTANRALSGCVSVWRGCAAQPFDPLFKEPAFSLNNPGVISTSASNVTLLASFYSNVGSTPAGFTTLANIAPMLTSYKTYATPQSGLSISDGGGSGETCMFDCLVGSAASPTLVGTPISFTATSSNSVTVTIPTANAGDIIYLQTVAGSRPVTGVGRMSYPFNFGEATGISPLITIQNCLTANFDPTTLSGGMVYNGNAIFDDGGADRKFPASSITLATNLAANPFVNGVQTGTPVWTTVFASSLQTNFDYRLAVSSPAKNAASNPGTSPRGQDLIPHYQTSWHGLPTPGTPITAKSSRSDVGPALTGSIGALT